MKVGLWDILPGTSYRLLVLSFTIPVSGNFHVCLPLLAFVPIANVEVTINPFRLLYGYIRTKMVTRCDFRTDISVHGLCDRNMGLLPASKRHFTVSRHEVFTWFRSAAGSHFIACLPTEEKWSLIGVVRCFWRVLENYDCRTKFNSSLGMEYNGEFYGFSAVKVKLVDSLIWRPFIPGWIRPRTPMTRRFDTCASFLFWTICSLNFRTLIDALCNNCY